MQEKYEGRTELYYFQELVWTVLNFIKPFFPTSVLLGLQKRADRLGDAVTEHKLSRETLEGSRSIKEACMIFFWSACILRMHSLLF